MGYIGHRIRELRNTKGITRIEFAEAIGITYSAASKYEANARIPGVKTLVKMADYFDVSADFLLVRDHILEMNSETLSSDIIKREYVLRNTL